MNERWRWFTGASMVGIKCGGCDQLMGRSADAVEFPLSRTPKQLWHVSCLLTVLTNESQRGDPAYFYHGH